MSRRLSLVLALFLGANVSLAQVESSPAILQIVVNGLDHGQKFVRITQDGDVLLTPKLLDGLRLKPELWEDQDEGAVSLRALSGRLQFDLNQNDAVLKLSLSPRWFKEQVIVREEPPAPVVEVEPVRPEKMAGFLNYNIRADVAEGRGVTTIASPLELGFNRGQWLALSTFRSRYDLEADSGETTRQFTTLFWDDRENLRTLSLGDFSQPYGFLLGGSSFGGISLRKSFRMDRSFRYTADLGLDAQIERPTHAKLRVNGQVLEEWDLFPGVVQFPGIGSYAAGDAELVLTDDFGRERILRVPAFTTQSVLRRGVHDYTYGFGWQRGNQGKVTYGDPALVGYHRYGFGDTWSAGVEFAATPEAIAAGPSLVALLGGFSQADLGFLVSDAESKGYTATARYSYRYRKVNGFLGITGTSRDYTRVPPPPGDLDVDVSNQSRLRSSANLSYGGDWGALGINYSESRYWDEATAPARILSLTYRNQLWRGLHFSVGLRHDLVNDGNDEGYISLRYYPAAGSTFFENASFTSSRNESGATENRLNLQKTPAGGPGWGYSADLLESKGDLLGSARGQYKNVRGLFAATATHALGETTASVSAAGALALVDGGLYQGRPISDSFAVVEVDGLDSVQVESGTSVAGVAEEGEGLLLPDLSSYGDNRVAVATPNLSMKYTSAQMSQVVKVGQRSGSLVKFRFTRFSAVEGSLYLATGEGERGKLQHVPIEYTVNGEKRDAFLAGEGYFYLENMPVGKSVIRVRLAGGDCLATLNVPDSDKIVVSLGALACTRESETQEDKQD